MPVLFLLALAHAAAAQTPESQPTIGFPPLVVETAGGDARLQLGVLVHADGRFALGDAQPSPADTFVVRRARAVIQGRLARWFEFNVTPDVGNGAAVLLDGYIETRFSTALRVRAGKTKTPFGLERLQPVAAILFFERAFPTAIAPNRDVGVQVLGDALGGALSYAAMISNGVTDGTSADADVNDGKDFTARVVVRPWARSTRRRRDLGVGGAVSTGLQPQALPVFRTMTGRVLFEYADATGVGRRTRVSPQAFYWAGPFGALAEYVRSTGPVRREGIDREASHAAWQLAASWVVTGEAATDRGVRPARNFDPSRGQWGALQIAARYSALTVHDGAETFEPAASGGLRARAVAVGANWYLNPFLKWVLDYEHTAVDQPSGAAPPAEHALLFRTQIAF